MNSLGSERTYAVTKTSYDFFKGRKNFVAKASFSQFLIDATTISDFYTKISKLSDFSFGEYHELVFADDLKKAEDAGGGDIGSEVYSRVADDRKDILIETKDGLRFTIQYYPSYGWINIAKTLSYYQMSPEIEEWFS